MIITWLWPNLRPFRQRWLCSGWAYRSATKANIEPNQVSRPSCLSGSWPTTNPTHHPGQGGGLLLHHNPHLHVASCPSWKWRSKVWKVDLHKRVLESSLFTKKFSLIKFQLAEWIPGWRWSQFIQNWDQNRKVLPAALTYSEGNFVAATCYNAPHKMPDLS